MGPKPLALLDSSTLLFLLSAEPAELDSAWAKRRTSVFDTIRGLQETHRFAIPAVAITELSREGQPRAAVEKISKALKLILIATCCFSEEQQQVRTDFLNTELGNSDRNLDQLVEVVFNQTLGGVLEVRSNGVADHVLVGSDDEGGAREKQE